ncbi:MAG: MFS transporter, partial [Steroidobacteraceae bacterium]
MRHDIDVAAAAAAPEARSTPAIADPTSAGGAREEPWPSAARAWYGVAVFAFALLSLFMGNGVLTLLIQPIEHDLHLSDVGVSLIVGAAASAFNAVFSLPVSRLVDIVSRRVLIGIGLLASGLSSAISGVSGTFGQLFLARMCGGIGGSANGPATFSMLADYFPPSKLPKALAVMNIGTYYGQAGALLLGGTLIAAIMRMHHIELPVLGALKAWQLVFLILAVPDLLLGVIVLTTLREPRRRGVRSSRSAAAARATQRVVPVREVLRFLFENGSAFGPMFLGLALTSLDAGTLLWLPTFFHRTYGWSTAFYGIVSGIILLVATPIGLLAG